ILEVVPGSSDFRTMRLDDGALVPVDGQASSEDEDVVYAALNDRGARVGWAIPGEGPGFMDTIRLIYGFDPDRRVIVGMAVLESRETPGLGDKIDDDEAFHENFEALEVEPEIVPVSDKTKPHQVDTITGATISSKAVVHIMNDTIERWMPVLTSQAVAEGGDASR
ncbi:MAG: FMN-binding protein, partial [Myxococcota bacterium]